MKNLVIKTAAIAILGATFANAAINAYEFQVSSNEASINQEYKNGDFNPFWFEAPKEPKVNAYSFDATSKDAQLYSSYKDGSFNPFWFQN